MARFSDNPIKAALAGNEIIPATDPSTGADIGLTPLIVTQFVLDNLAISNGSTQGLIDGPNYAKLLDLDTQAKTDIRVAQLAEVAIPIFIGSPPSVGSLTIYQHVLDVPWALSSLVLAVSAGSTNITLLKNGAAINGFTGLGAISTPAFYAVGAGSTNHILYPNDTFGISFSGTTGNCANLMVSVRANATIAT